MIYTLDILAALADLTPSEREALIDRAVLGDSGEQIAERMGCTRSWVGQLEQSAIRKMKRLLQPHADLAAAA